MKRKFAVILMGISICAALAACGESAEEAVTPQKSSVQENVVDTDVIVESKESTVESPEVEEPSEETWMEDGITYIGFKTNGLLDGEGICIYENGECYVGEFVDGKREGAGTLYSSAQPVVDLTDINIEDYISADVRYEGEWNNDRMEGIGTYYFDDGSRYNGEFKESRLEGQGIMYLADGTYAEGEWADGERVGDLIWYSADGVLLEQDMGNDDDNIVEMGEKMLKATVDGEEVYFYQEMAQNASDGFELRYVSFTQDGEPQYSMYLRIPLTVKAGSYSNSGAGNDFAEACYFSISTRYNPEGGTWGDSYRMVHYSSSKTEDIGTYSITLDGDIDWNIEEGSGTFEAEMIGFSSATEGKSVSVTNGSFYYTRRDAHSVVQAWQGGGAGQDSEAWTDPYSDIDKREKTTCTVCGGTGKTICTYCEGAGTLIQRKEGIDLGSGGKSYTVEVKCGCNNGFYKCWRCSGKGYVY